jgi:hypothetical protein
MPPCLRVGKILTGSQYSMGGQAGQNNFGYYPDALRASVFWLALGNL